MLKTLTEQPLRGNFTALQIEVLNYVAKNNVPEGEPKPTEPKPTTPKIETKKVENMKKTTNSRKQRKEQNILAYNISMALSKCTAIMMGEPDKYKTTNGGINYYPSDCLN